MTLPPEILDSREAGKILKAARKALGLTQGQVIDAVGIPNQSYMSALENGRYNVANSEYFPALAQLLRLTIEQVREINPSAVITVAADPGPRRGPPIPPVVPFRETPITIPHELLEMVEKHGDNYPILRTPQMQRMLAAPRNFGGAEVGPQTAEDWFDYWMANKRFLT
ncbi:helix-turn-helix domain-containing protein [Deinococcus sp. HMF7620]|uniref:Helix-turn-helix domain-containing protein n=1 Tax=Deinococcus arboris TaxID=2682977 RepID=A0A7C9HRH6_9DEIO|nr:helix-turn-helix transcriptional regulator [Deinococcus arboris]MVN86853.1 helix-turn-helix domain-containing protein [Deinococcus arboris]